MKNLAKVSAILITVLTMASCSSTQGVTSSKRVAEEVEEVKFENVALKLKDSDVITIIPQRVK